jgi:transposase-like protein
MTRKYRSHTPEFKLKVAIEATRTDKTINQIASEYAVAPNQVAEWKKQLLSEGSSIFQGKRTTKILEAYEDVSCLQQQIGKLTVQVDWLKKKQGIAS